MKSTWNWNISMKYWNIEIFHIEIFHIEIFTFLLQIFTIYLLLRCFHIKGCPVSFCKEQSGDNGIGSNLRYVCMCKRKLSRFSHGQLWPHALWPTSLLCPWDSPGRILEWVAISSPGDLPNAWIKPVSAALQVDSLPSEPPGKALRYEYLSWKLKVPRLPSSYI